MKEHIWRNGCHDTQHNGIQHNNKSNTTLSIMQSIVMMSVTYQPLVLRECHDAEAVMVNVVALTKWRYATLIPLPSPCDQLFPKRQAIWLVLLGTMALSIMTSSLTITSTTTPSIMPIRIRKVDALQSVIMPNVVEPLFGRNHPYPAKTFCTSCRS